MSHLRRRLVRSKVVVDPVRKASPRRLNLDIRLHFATDVLLACMEFKLIQYSGRLVVANLHAADETVLYQVDVLHHLIDEDFAGEIANDLMDVSGSAAIRFRGEIGGFDVRVEDRPLASPIVSHLCVTVRATVFH